MKGDDTVRWSEVCHVFQLMGLMERYPDSSGASRTEALRVSKLLKKRIDAGQVEKIARGVYRLR